MLSLYLERHSQSLHARRVHEKAIVRHPNSNQRQTRKLALREKDAVLVHEHPAAVVPDAPFVNLCRSERNAAARFDRVHIQSA